MAKKQTFMSRVKAYRKLHPRISQVDAMKKLSGTTATGKKGKVAAKPRKAVGAVKKAAPKRKTVIRTEKLQTIGRVKKRTSGTGLAAAEAIVKKIDSLHKKVAATKNPELKNIYKLATNAQYDKLDAIKRNLKAR